MVLALTVNQGVAGEAFLVITEQGNYLPLVAAPVVASQGVVLAAVNGSAQSIPSGAITQLTGWTVVADTAAAPAFNPTTGVWTCPVAGLYSIAGASQMGQTLADGTFYGLLAAVGAVSFSHTGVTGGVENASPGLPSQIFQLAAGDQVKLSWLQSSGAPRTISATAQNTYLTIQQVAAA